MQKPNGDTVAAFFAQVSQSSTVAPPPNPLQSLMAKPGAFSLEALEGDKPMPPLPSHAKTASDLESDIKTKKSPFKKTTAATTTTTPKSSKAKPTVKEENVNGSSVSYARVAANSQLPPTQPQQQPPVKVEEKQPQLMSPMVFAATNPVQNQVQPVSTPVIAPQPLLPPMNGISPAKPQITPLTEAQLLQVNKKLFRFCLCCKNFLYLITYTFGIFQFYLHFQTLFTHWK